MEIDVSFCRRHSHPHRNVSFCGYEFALYFGGRGRSELSSRSSTSSSSSSSRGLYRRRLGGGQQHVYLLYKHKLRNDPQNEAAAMTINTSVVTPISVGKNSLVVCAIICCAAKIMSSVFSDIRTTASLDITGIFTKTFLA